MTVSAPHQILTRDPQQPDVYFAFGWQPAEFRGADKGKKFGIIGLNDVWKKFIGPSVLQRGAELYFCDLSAERAAEAKQMAEEAGCVAHIVTLEDMPKDMDGIYVLTPPTAHLPLVKQIAALMPDTPIAVEKPLTSTREDMVALATFVEQNNVPLYGIDWTLLNKQPLAYAVGQNVPFPEALSIENPDEFKKFDFSAIIEIIGRDIEGGGNALADVSAVAKDRPWMINFLKGGGVTFDMIVHLVNALVEMGLCNDRLTAVHLGSPTNTPGIYERITDQETGDLYARAYGHARLEGIDCDIPYTLECGKNGAFNDQFIELVDRNGYVLHWEIIPSDEKGRIPGSKLELRAPQGEMIASISMGADAYALVVAEFSRYCEEVKTGGPVVTESHFNTHDKGMHWVLDMHDYAREPGQSNVKSGERIQQLAVMEANATLPRPRGAMRLTTFVNG